MEAVDAEAVEAEEEAEGAGVLLAAAVSERRPSTSDEAASNESSGEGAGLTADDKAEEAAEAAEAETAEVEGTCGGGRVAGAAATAAAAEEEADAAEEEAAAEAEAEAEVAAAAEDAGMGGAGELMRAEEMGLEVERLCCGGAGNGFHRPCESWGRV